MMEDNGDYERKEFIGWIFYHDTRRRLPPLQAVR